MIYTVTFNPSLDYIVTVPDFTLGVVNRTTEEIIFPGGKGINVSMVLKNLGFDSRISEKPNKKAVFPQYKQMRRWNFVKYLRLKMIENG